MRGTKAEEEIKGGHPNLTAFAYLGLSLPDAGDEDAFAVLKRLLWTVTEIVNSFEPEFSV